MASFLPLWRENLPERKKAACFRKLPLSTLKNIIADKIFFVQKHFSQIFIQMPQ